MAGAARGWIRAAIPGAAARGAGRDPAGPPALLPGARRRREADAALHRGREHRQQRSGPGPGRQRAGGAAAARGCRVFLRGRPQGDASIRAAQRLAAVTFQAQLGSLADKSRPGHGSRRPDRARRGAGPGTGAARRRTRQMRPADRHGRRIPGAAGRDGPLLRAARRRADGGRDRARRAVPAPLCRRRPAVDRRRPRARRRGQARHPGRHLRHRPEADRRQGSVWPAPLCARRAADPDRDRHCARPARTDQQRRSTR